MQLPADPVVIVVAVPSLLIPNIGQNVTMRVFEILICTNPSKMTIRGPSNDKLWDCVESRVIREIRVVVLLIVNI